MPGLGVKRCLVLLVLWGLLGSVLGLPVWAQQASPRRSSMAEAGHLERLKSVLNLSAEQLTAIAAIQEEGRTEASRLKAELRAKRHAMMAYVSSTSADQAKAMEHLQDVEAIRTQLSALRLQTWFKIRDVLTPEQLQRMQILREKRPKRSSQFRPSLSPPGGAVLSVFG